MSVRVMVISRVYKSLMIILHPIKARKPSLNTYNVNTMDISKMHTSS
jgi:hypothetical protein